MSQIRDHAKRVYEVDVTRTEAIVFVNWIKARNLRGFMQMYRFIPGIYGMMRRAREHGLIDLHMAIAGPNELIVVSYWESAEALRDSYRDPFHVTMMRYTFRHPDDLILGNETYAQPTSTRYLNEAGGYALTQSTTQTDINDFFGRHGVHEEALG